MWAKIDLSQEEQYLVNRYRFKDAVLVEGDPLAIFKKAARSAGLLCVPVFAVLSYLFGIGIAVVIRRLAAANGKCNAGTIVQDPKGLPYQ